MDKMFGYGFFGYLILLVFVTSFISSSTQQQLEPHYIHRSCPNTTRTYSNNSSKSSSKLKSLLFALSSNNIFYSTKGIHKTGAPRQSPDDVVFGHFLCRGDLSREVCRECVVFAAKDILSVCPEEKTGWILYDECMLRYADQGFSLDSSFDNDYAFYITRHVTSNQDQFKDLIFSLLKVSTIEAAGSLEKFSARKAKLTASQSVYVMVQCTPDLTTQDCLSCLEPIINKLPTEKVGGRIIAHSCNSRYEMYSFYNETVIRLQQSNSMSSPPPASPPPPLSTSVPSPPPGKGGKSYVIIIIAVVVPITVVLLLSVAVFGVWVKKTRTVYETEPFVVDRDDITTAGSLQFGLKTIEVATNKFSQSNKLGQGGFGEVYKGTFANGVQVAVKRLSKTSRQGEREFENEVVVVAKLQHRNLVRLLGFCLEGDEKILVYEFVRNKSLDYFLFDSTMQIQLNWPKRYNIIKGIARGILYLHQDSHLTIIHRDLKAGNILLDAEMNPKVADFGMARIFEMDQTEANTRRVVGTYGYMSPEYAMYGHFSIKSDVYSFGVLILEIISGKKNSSLYQMDENAGNLVTYAWRLWNNMSPLDLVDPSFGDNYQTNEITRCIHIALLCVQEDANDRPTMSTILQMLTTRSISLVVPRQPGFFFGSRHEQVQRVGLSTNVLYSIDDASITQITPR